MALLLVTFDLKIMISKYLASWWREKGSGRSCHMQYMVSRQVDTVHCLHDIINFAFFSSNGRVVVILLYVNTLAS